jgi:HSP20 family protein
MSIIKFNKGALLPRAYDLLEDFLGGDMGAFKSWMSGHSLPAVNIEDKGDSFIIAIAAPGMNKKDFNIELHEGVLSVSSEKKEEKKETDNNYVRKEFSYQSFKRSFRLPCKVNADKVNASYNDGVLQVSLPKAELSKNEQVKQIAVS